MLLKVHPTKNSHPGATDALKKLNDAFERYLSLFIKWMKNSQFASLEIYTQLFAIAPYLSLQNSITQNLYFDLKNITKIDPVSEFNEV